MLAAIYEEARFCFSTLAFRRRKRSMFFGFRASVFDVENEFWFSTSFSLPIGRRTLCRKAKTLFGFWFSTSRLDRPYTVGTVKYEFSKTKKHFLFFENIGYEYEFFLNFQKNIIQSMSIDDRSSVHCCTHMVHAIVASLSAVNCLSKCYFATFEVYFPNKTISWRGRNLRLPQKLVRRHIRETRNSIFPH